MRISRYLTAPLALALTACATHSPADFAATSDAEVDLVLDPASFIALHRVDPRFQSYNVEMVEVTGGRFWAPYEVFDPAGGAEGRYAYQPPVDLSNPRLRKLAAALGPAYMRVSGTWSNKTAFVGINDPADVPEGYDQALTDDQWRGVVDFAKAVDAELVVTFATGDGTRDSEGRWTSGNAADLVSATRRFGGKIAAASFINEPNWPTISGLPEGYSAQDYGRDADRFAQFIRRHSPGTLVLGPDSVGEGQGSLANLTTFGQLESLPSEDLLAAAREPVDVFAYHHYGALSERCPAGPINTSTDLATEERFLGQTMASARHYAALRDQYAPESPLWLTETGQAACGGDRWAKTFLDSFRYLDQNGRLARFGVDVVAHNTLARSDYALLDSDDFSPRPNYWAALLWARLMGPQVLDSGVEPGGDLRVYAHCRKNAPGATVLAINLSREAAATFRVAGATGLYRLEVPVGSQALTSPEVNLNGATLRLGPGDAMPAINPAETGETITLSAASIAFVTTSSAPPACDA